MASNLTLKQVKNMLAKARLSISEEKRTGNNLGTTLKLTNGCIVNCWDKGTANCQGKNKEVAESILTDVKLANNQSLKEVFVVYGHDGNARTQHFLCGEPIHVSGEQKQPPPGHYPVHQRPAAGVNETEKPLLS